MKFHYLIAFTIISLLMAYNKPLVVVIPVKPLPQELLSWQKLQAKTYKIPQLQAKRNVKVAVIDGFFQRNETDLNVKNIEIGAFTQQHADHATHVVGILLMANPQLEIFNYNVYPANTKTNEITVLFSKAIEDAITKKVDIINISLYGKEYDKMEFQSIMKALSYGIKVVVSAGNSNEELKKGHCNIFPACYKEYLPDMIVVGNIDNNSHKHPSSNYGDLVDYYYYGDRIYSLNINKDFQYMTGTSMSAPMISGIISQFLGQEKLSIHELKMKLNYLPTKPDPFIDLPALSLK